MTCSAKRRIERCVSAVLMPGWRNWQANCVMRPSWPPATGARAAITSSGVPTAALQNPAFPERIISAVTALSGGAGRPSRSLRVS